MRALSTGLYILGSAIVFGVFVDTARLRAGAPTTFAVHESPAALITAGLGGTGATVESAGRGGDIIFSPGRAGQSSDESRCPERDGQIRFILADGTDALRIAPNGDVFVRGRLVATDAEVYDGLRAWLRAAGIVKAPATDGGTP